MIPSLGALALAGLAAATGIIEPRHEMFEVRDAPSYVHPRDLLSSGAHPCRIMSIVYEESGHKGGTPLWAAIPPSIGVACLKSVPYDKERDLALLDYLEPYIHQQSTLETLANPPEGYLLPGVDILAGIEQIRTNLRNEAYASQYEVMTDLRSLYVAAADGHFEYPPALLSAFWFARRGLNFTSISKDGVAHPSIFLASEVELGNKGQLTYHPSAVKYVDDIPVADFLENEALYYTANHQDPDAQYNSLFASRHGSATGKGEKLTYSVYEIPDTYTLTFYNGSTLVINNEIVFLGATDFSDIHTGEDLVTRFELPPTGKSKSKRSEIPSHEEYKRSLLKRASSGIAGYPEAVAKHSMNSVAGYFPDGDDYKDIAVLSVLSFLPIGFDFNKAGNFDLGEFVLEATDVIVEFVTAAKKEGRDKLILDLSSNGGGSVVLAQQIYQLLFPDGGDTDFGRWRATGALEAMAAADYDSLVQILITNTPFYPLGSDGKHIKTGKDWFGPYTAKGQNVTAAFQEDITKPWDAKNGFYYNGYDPQDPPDLKDSPFKPENIIVVTDGTCGSACTILTGLLTRNHGIRTVATGGRSNGYAMQAMGGVKGTLLQINANFLQSIYNFVEAVQDNKEAMSILTDAEDDFPDLENPPLRPLPDGTSFGQFNARNGYTEDDLEGYPVQFRYEAANCKLFYTQRMTFDVSETWRKVAKIGWGGASCVVGSTTNPDGTIGKDAPGYDKRVLSRFGW